MGLLPFLRHLFWIYNIRHIAALGPTLRMFTFRVFRPMGTQRIERVPFMIFAGGIYELGEETIFRMRRRIGGKAHKYECRGWADWSCSSRLTAPGGHEIILGALARIECRASSVSRHPKGFS